MGVAAGVVGFWARAGAMVSASRVAVGNAVAQIFMMLGV